jgi:hypothetical protein
MAKHKERPGIDTVQNWREDATNEKGFGSIILSSIGVVGSKVDLATFVVVLVCGAVGVTIARTQFNQLVQPWQTAMIVQQWANFAATVAVAILGFLITGFSVFATMTRPSLFHLLAKIRQTNRNISEFKFVFYNFMYVFAGYIAYLSVCMFMVFAFTKQSPVWYAGYLIWKFHPVSLDIAVAFCGVLVVAFSLFAILLLKSFLWNLYQAMLFTIFVEEAGAQEPS